MGQARAKAKNLQPDLTDEERLQMLGENIFGPAYDFLFNMAQHVYTSVGGVNHELIGVDCKDGKPVGVNILRIRRIEDVPRLREEMLQKWPLVAHVFEAWAAPDASCPAHAHPQRYDIVSIMLNTIELSAAATCRVDEARKTIERGELQFLSALGGRLGRELPTKH
ncbi:MAG: hypothetical protein K2W33_07520 [Burkholderiales bacterium]|nr:hypothetical protein [Burkholderiales bacterium]